jgi:Mg2+/Co2+ transporter CorB
MVNVSDKPEDIVSFVLNSPHTRLPIYSGKPENIIGVLHVKDLLRGLQNSNPETLEEFDVAKIASPTYFIPETTLLASQLQAFRTRREHFAIVVDEYGDFRGIVTLEDIIEEIVGDIDDEHDEELAGCTAQADGSYVVDGNVTIRDLNRILDLTLPDDDASTVAGLLLYETRTIPLPGQEFKIHGMRFRVVHRENNQITSLRIWTKQKNTSPKKSTSSVTE